VSRIPCEAREGLMRAWLEILRERHPEVMWLAASDTGMQDEVLATDGSASQEAERQAA
jgi:hypothetical protein